MRSETESRLDVFAFAGAGVKMVVVWRGVCSPLRLPRDLMKVLRVKVAAELRRMAG